MTLKGLVELPDGWTETHLAEIAEIIMGQSPPGNSYNQEGHGTPLINGPVEFGPKPFSKTIKSKFTTSPTKECEENDLILCVRGSTTGRMNIAGFNACIGRGVAAIRYKPYQKYINFFIHSIRENIYRMGTGSTFPNVSGNTLGKISIALPPLNEQRRIVAKVEELRAHTLRSQQALDEIPALIDQFRQSVLAAAFRGDLTADWRKKNPNVEPADKILRQFEVNREKEYKEQCKRINQQGITKPPKLPSIQRYEDSENLPESWLNISVESGSIFIIDCLHSTPKFQNSGEYCIDTTCIEPFKIHWERARKVGKEDFIKRTSRLLPEEGDLLFSREGTIGTTVKVPKGEKLCLGQRMMMFRLSSDILPRYAEMYFQSPFFISQYKPLITGTTSPHLNIGEIRKLQFLIPPLKEQKEIVRKADHFLKVIDFILHEYRENENDLNQLNQSILAKAFRGELVPQNPNDEPASVLLDRIRAEREKLGTTTTQKRSSRKRTQQQ